MLEKLEARDCPSNISLITTVQDGNMLAISGRVTNAPSPGGLTVNLQGTAPGTATTDANGNYSVTLQASGSGPETAQTSDGLSNLAMVSVSMQTITQFTYFSYPLHMFMFTGHVNGPNSAGETVNFAGIKDMQGKSTTVDSNGNFTITVQLDGLSDDTGNVTAQVTDSNGITSNLDWVYVSVS
jgi:hypothetical protein